MRKLLLLLLALTLLVPSALAEDECLNRAVALANRLDGLASTPGYIGMMTMDEDIAALAAAFGEGDHSQPRMMVAVRFDLPEAYPQHLAAQAIGNSLRSRHGYQAVAATSILTCSDIFAGNAMGSGGLLLLYEDAAPVYVVWQGQDGAVGLTASFLMNEDALTAAQTPEDVAAWLLSEDIPATCTLVTDKLPAVQAVSADADLFSRAVVTAARMANKANDPEFAAMYGASPEVARLAESWAQGSDVPIAAYTVAFLTAPWVFPDTANWPATVLGEVALRMAASQAAAIVGYHEGTEALAAMSVLSTDDLFAGDAEGTGHILLLYEEMQPILVTWRGQDGAVSLNAAFLPLDDVFAQIEAVSPGFLHEPIPLP